MKEYINIKYSSFEFSNNEQKSYGLNILIRIIFPTMYVIILAGIFYNIGKVELVKGIYLITVFFYLIRWLNIIFVLNRKELQNWKSEIIIVFIGLIINGLLYKFFITKTNQIFISIEEIRDGVWIAIITFVFVMIKDYIYNYAMVDTYNEQYRKENYILKKYEYFKNKYEHIIKTRNRKLALITYSIMIYENYNRPKLVRILENIKFIFKGSATLGVMQVYSRNLISDEISVKKGFKIIKKEYYKLLDLNKKSQPYLQYDIVTSTIAVYNTSEKYIDEVRYIFDILNAI